jgi:hypothetical protein
MHEVNEVAAVVYAGQIAASGLLAHLLVQFMDVAKLRFELTVRVEQCARGWKFPMTRACPEGEAVPGSAIRARA